MTTSVIITVKGRKGQLSNTLYGLANQSCLPGEVLIIQMNEPLESFSGYPFPVRSLQLINSKVSIPLSEARNLGAQFALGDLLLFLDVDCIPDTEWSSRLIQLSESFDGLLMGDIAYLTQCETDQYSDKKDLSMLKGDVMDFRPVPPSEGIIQDADYSLFWTLNFAIRRPTFKQLGGFDEAYKGYGAEDTDFAFRARKLDIPFGICNALVYHQYHNIYDPPINHFHSIINNARRFHKIHQVWPMDNWLEAFAAEGLIEFNGEITVLREPTSEEIKRKKVTDGRSYK